MSQSIIDGVRNYSNITTSVRYWSGESTLVVLIAEFLLPPDRNPASIDSLSRAFVRSSRQIQDAFPRSLEVAL